MKEKAGGRLDWFAPIKQKEVILPIRRTLDKFVCILIVGEVLCHINMVKRNIAQIK